jgi:ornithine carbamoyltransferase
MKRDLLSIEDLSPDELGVLLDTAEALKSGRLMRRQALRDHAMALIFEKPSLRTRVSFELAMAQLGGSTIMLAPSDVQLGIRESVADVARTLSGYVQVIVGRVFSHATLEELARSASIPVDGRNECVCCCAPRIRAAR